VINGELVQWVDPQWSDMNNSTNPGGELKELLEDACGDPCASFSDSTYNFHTSTFTNVPADGYNKCLDAPISRDGLYIAQHMQLLCWYDVTVPGAITPVQSVPLATLGHSQKMDVCDFTGNIIYLNMNVDTAFYALDENGVAIGSFPIPSGRDIITCMDTDDNGDVWAVTEENDFSPTQAAYLDHFIWDGSTYIYDAATSVAIPEVDMTLYEYAAIPDIAVSYTDDKILVLYAESQMPGDQPETSEYVAFYDISSGVPVYEMIMQDPIPGNLGFWSFGGRIMCVDIEIDHSDPALESCRVYLNGRTWYSNGQCTIKMDIDGNILDQDVEADFNDPTISDRWYAAIGISSVPGNNYLIGQWDVDPASYFGGTQFSENVNVWLPQCPTVGIVDPLASAENELVLYPNPTDGNFSIDLGENYQTVTITITDIVGRTISSKTYNESQLLKLNIEEPAGIYLVMIESEDKKAVIRLVKE